VSHAIALHPALAANKCLSTNPTLTLHSYERHAAAIPHHIAARSRSPPTHSVARHGSSPPQPALPHARDAAVFIDPDAPTSNYTLATNHLKAPFNMATFNDGYHITHHVSSTTHWSEMPLHFITHLDKYEAAGALVFRGVSFEEMTIAAFSGERGLRNLARHVVQLTPERKSEDELVAVLRRRLQPIPSREPKPFLPEKAVCLANEAFWVGAWLWGFPTAIIPVTMLPVFHSILYWASL
jgi:hypothetical protein